MTRMRGVFLVALAALSGTLASHPAAAFSSYYQGTGGSGVSTSGSFINGDCLKNVATGSTPTIADAGAPCGTGSVTPAGSNGDIQINSSGSLGALTPGTGVSTFIATPSGANLATALTTALPASKGGTGLTALGTGIATALGINTGVAGAPLLNTVPRGQSVGWIATVNPLNATVFVAANASTVTSIVGAVETATGSAATISVFKAPSGTACSGGTVLHSGSFNANGTAATNQTLTLTTTSLAAGDRVCLQTTGTTSWTGGTGIGGISVNITVP